MAEEPEIVTFGCRLNAYESEVIRELARTAGVGPLVVVNTCAVTAEAERQARQAIRSVRRRRPEARVVVTGCAAQIHPRRFAEMPEVDLVLGNGEKLERETWSDAFTDLPSPEGTGARVRVGDIAAVRETASHLVTGFAEHTRAFVQVQNGCDHRCTFCIIPFGRGPSRSVPGDQVVAQVRQLAEAGVGEVVLSGVDLTAYGEDLPVRARLGTLVRRILREVPALRRLRLSSLDPVEIDEELWDVLADEPRLMPHLHLSLQAGDDVVLKRMKRRHVRADALAAAERARRARPDVALGADLIAGFPTESDTMFDRTLALVEDLGLVYLHVFPYSPRPGTPAARMPQISGPVRKERAARLRAAGEAALGRFLTAKIGASADLLMESGDLGRTEDFALVRVTDGAPAGSFVRVRIEGIEGERLVGRGDVETSA
ncbi:MAG: tRNA (N(6)-L-threonylcarbamoyladenosine(37)-C(2))-methylthiotransferase MtaB [Deltaproteobacteria bacterium]|nr:tRNA (N(6)-L-threonylcarbamoyladenosine(37)-C(2))-methylthiotransferase MtaB [Deltaproteobacteria bacterium]